MLYTLNSVEAPEPRSVAKSKYKTEFGVQHNVGIYVAALERIAQELSGALLEHKRLEEYSSEDVRYFDSKHALSSALFRAKDLVQLFIEGCALQGEAASGDDTYYLEEQFFFVHNKINLSIISHEVQHLEDAKACIGALTEIFKKILENDCSAKLNDVVPHDERSQDLVLKISNENHGSRIEAAEEEGV
jgi:hypothetical protein